MSRRGSGFCLAFSLSALLCHTAAADFIVKPGAPGTAIHLPAHAGPVAAFAAEELQDHLQMILDVELPVVADPAGWRNLFHVGVRAPGDDRPLTSEEARYRVTDQAVYLYGFDEVNRPGKTPKLTCLGHDGFRHNRTGSLFAVYEFLENELGVRWIEPGEDGIVAEPRGPLRLARGTGRWLPSLRYQRNFRSYAWRGAADPAIYLPEAFVLSEEDRDRHRAELDHWLRRQRMGGSAFLNYGHAFHDWWETYGADHPEYFALTGQGFRGPLNPNTPDRVKMCVSNPGVVEQAVANWLEGRAQDPLGYPAVCVAQNDGGGGGETEYCHCDACLALDVRLAGEALDDHLTDRYITLANRTIAAARRYDPQAEVTMYAYAPTRLPPRRERLLPGIVPQFVTGMDAELEDTRQLYADWQKAGVEKFLFRPNDLCVDFGLPLGQEKQIFEHQQIAVDLGAMGTDHDCVYGFWTGVSGLTYYALARATYDPSRSFEYWEADYARTFGAAAPDVLNFHHHWRQKFDEKIWPAHRQAVEAKGEGFLKWHRLRAISTQVRSFYDEADFDETDRYLERGLARDLSAGERYRLNRLKLANQHSRATFAAMVAVNEGDQAQIQARAQELLALRQQLRQQLRFNWRVLFSEQHQMGDATGVTGLLVGERLANRRTFTARRVPGDARIDGHLDEDWWDGARCPLPFITNNEADTPMAATHSYMAWDDEYLYLALVCEEPYLEAAVERTPERDGAAWEDNSVEIFLDPGLTRSDFHQLIITSHGVLLDGRRVNGVFSSAWNATADELTYAVQRGDDDWTLELRLRHDAIGLDPIAGTAAGFDLMRDRNLDRPNSSERSALRPTFGGYHMPDKYAQIVLRGK